MASGWFIEGIELPIGPRSESKSVNRTFQQESIYKNYPAIFKPMVTSYSYTLGGYIYGDSTIRQLEQLAKSADTEVVTVIPPDGIEGTTLHVGYFAFSNFTVQRNQPMFTQQNGVTVRVYEYTMVLTEFADEGVNANSVELETLEGEEFLGYADQLDSSEELDAIGSFVDNYANLLTDPFNLN